jgi:hypothetical protein
MKNDLVLSPLKQIAAACNCSRDTLMRWIREEEFPAAKIDGTWRAVPSEVVVWFQMMIVKERLKNKSPSK